MKTLSLHLSYQIHFFSMDIDVSIFEVLHVSVHLLLLGG